MSDKDNEKYEERLVLRGFKAQVFDTFWERFGTFFLHILPHPGLEIGKRGLLKEEQESGIVIVIGPKAIRDISSQPDHLFVELQFGYKWEKLVIPWDAVFRMYDKSQSAVFQTKVFTDYSNEEPVESVSKAEKKPTGKKKSPNSNVIQVDFGAKK
ncbi:MAG: ClpXP protease specificity-enhancing factor SspB [Leptospiraceae bacterium]|nr:stringent starvation protein B [Leptospiraceae bacterium]MCK6380778.1 ClpXP protease specificity-enhancing factor SspB [Leptospiraceae bacterium]NUM41619.1 stringent starvation protein B [Leptospiraceae bacterium]